MKNIYIKLLSHASAMHVECGRSIIDGHSMSPFMSYRQNKMLIKHHAESGLAFANSEKYNFFACLLLLAKGAPVTWYEIKLRFVRAIGKDKV